MMMASISTSEQPQQQQQQQQQPQSNSKSKSPAHQQPQNNNKKDTKKDKGDDQVGIEKPGVNDVISGRGDTINRHPGNVQFRNLVDAQRRVYNCARFKREKRMIAESIIDSVANMDPPGRFLMFDNKAKKWLDMGQDKAREKTSQALREKKHSTKKGINGNDADDAAAAGEEEEDDDLLLENQHHQQQQQQTQTSFGYPPSVGHGHGHQPGHEAHHGWTGTSYGYPYPYSYPPNYGTYGAHGVGFGQQVPVAAPVPTTTATTTIHNHYQVGQAHPPQQGPCSCNNTTATSSIAMQTSSAPAMTTPAMYNGNCGAAPPLANSTNGAAATTAAALTTSTRTTGLPTSSHARVDLSSSAALVEAVSSLLLPDHSSNSTIMMDAFEPTPIKPSFFNDSRSIDHIDTSSSNDSDDTPLPWSNASGMPMDMAFVTTPTIASSTSMVTDSSIYSSSNGSTLSGNNRTNEIEFPDDIAAQLLVPLPLEPEEPTHQELNRHYQDQPARVSHRHSSSSSQSQYRHGRHHQSPRGSHLVDQFLLASTHKHRHRRHHKKNKHGYREDRRENNLNSFTAPSSPTPASGGSRTHHFHNKRPLSPVFAFKTASESKFLKSMMGSFDLQDSGDYHHQIHASPSADEEEHEIASAILEAMPNLYNSLVGGSDDPNNNSTSDEDHPLLLGSSGDGTISPIMTSAEYSAMSASPTCMLMMSSTAASLDDMLFLPSLMFDDDLNATSSSASSFVRSSPNMFSPRAA